MNDENALVRNVAKECAVCTCMKMEEPEMNPERPWWEMLEIRLGLEHDVDVNKYADPKLSREQMRKIRLRLENEKEQKIPRRKRSR